MKYIKLYEEIEFKGRSIEEDISYIIKSSDSLRLSIKRKIKQHFDIDEFSIDQTSSLCDHQDGYLNDCYTDNLGNDETFINKLEIKEGKYLKSSIRIGVNISKKENVDNKEFHKRILILLSDLRDIEGVSISEEMRFRRVRTNITYDRYGGYSFQVYCKVENLFNMSKKGVVNINK